MNDQTITSLKGILKWSSKTVFLLFGTLVLGTMCHEVLGHGLTGVLCGGSIGDVEIMGLQIHPEFVWIGYHGQYGSCSVYEIPSRTGEDLMSLGGSMSTWIVSLVAIILFWCRPWRGWPRMVLIYLGIWWIDLLAYTFPVWGLRHSILWGATYSEPFDAAINLGVPSWLYQVFVLLSSAALAVALGLRIRMTARECKTDPARQPQAKGDTRR